jgi:hypothetical protein
MNRKFAFLITTMVLLILVFAGCGKNNEDAPPSNLPEQSSDLSPAPVEPSSSPTEPDTADDEALPDIKMTIGQSTYIVKLYDTPASRELVEMLPLTLDFSDFGGSEKIAYLPDNLQIPEDQEQYEAVRGDLTVYVPWGNLAFFYQDYTYSSSLYRLGHMEEIDALANIEGGFSATLETMN